MRHNMVEKSTLSREILLKGLLVTPPEVVNTNKGYHQLPGQAIPPPLFDGLVGLHHKLLNH